MERKASVNRTTKETDIAITLTAVEKLICLPASDFLTICWMALRDTVFLIWTVK